MAPPDIALLERCLSFEIELERRCSEEVVEADWGTAFLAPSLPLVWDASWLLVERTGLTAAEIAELADEALGGTGFAHRTIVVRDLEDSARLASEFAALDGWNVQRTVYMSWRGDGRAPGMPVEECRHAEIEPLRRALIGNDIPSSGPRTAETVEQLLAWERRLGEAGGDRWFVARGPDGEPASSCRLLAAGGVGQVEDVGTLAAARERGLARAVTLAAARASVAEGNELTFLGALADDWPRLIYERIGFEPLGEALAFRRKPVG